MLSVSAKYAYKFLMLLGVLYKTIPIMKVSWCAVCHIILTDTVIGIEINTEKVTFVDPIHQGREV